MVATKLDQEKAFELLLVGNLSRVNDFLKFAEAKNAALLTFCSAWILGTFSFVAISKVLSIYSSTGLGMSVILLLFSCGFCINALLPQLLKSKFNSSAERELANLFFGRIAAKTQEEFMQLINERYTPSNGSLYTQEYIEDILSQMHTASQIARRKFDLFNSAARITFIAMLTLTASVALDYAIKASAHV